MCKYSCGIFVAERHCFRTFIFLMCKNTSPLFFFFNSSTMKHNRIVKFLCAWYGIFQSRFLRHPHRYSKNWTNWHCLIRNELLVVPVCDIASLEGIWRDLWRMHELQYKALQDNWTRRGNNAHFFKIRFCF